MSDGQTLFLILSLLYLYDCLVWIRSGSVLFVSPWCCQWRLKFPNQWAGTTNGGLDCLNPLPPLGAAFLAHWSPISISPQGVSDFTLQRGPGNTRRLQQGSVLKWEEITDIRTDGRSLLLNETCFVKCGTASQAQEYAEVIRRACREPTANRETVLIEFITLAFSKTNCSTAIEHVTSLTSRIRWTCSSLFVFLYVFVPILATTYGLIWFLIPAAAIMFLMASVVAFQYYRAHLTLYPAGKADRIGNVVKMVLCPPVAIRACDLLTLDAVSCFHPVLVGSILLRADAGQFVGSVIRNLQHPLSTDQCGLEPLSVAFWHANAEREAITHFLEKDCNRPLDEFLVPPPWDGLSKFYCPRCLCQFTGSTGDCPDCPGVGMLPMPIQERTDEQR